MLKCHLWSALFLVICYGNGPSYREVDLLDAPSEITLWQCALERDGRTYTAPLLLQFSEVSFV